MAHGTPASSLERTVASFTLESIGPSFMHELSLNELADLLHKAIPLAESEAQKSQQVMRVVRNELRRRYRSQPETNEPVPLFAGPDEAQPDEPVPASEPQSKPIAEEPPHPKDDPYLHLTGVNFVADNKKLFGVQHDLPPASFFSGSSLQSGPDNSDIPDPNKD